MTIAVIRPSRESGSVTAQKVRTEFTPRSREASSSRPSIRSNEAKSGMMKNGR
jgi:hypothetical protein